MRNRHRNRRGPRRGAAAVELAACLPILFLVVFAAYEFGRANMLHHACESAAYEGARIGMVPGATPAKIRTAAQSVLNSVGVRDARIRITPSAIDNSTPRVRVEIDIPMKTNTIVPMSFTRESVFTGQCELSREIL